MAPRRPLNDRDLATLADLRDACAASMEALGTEWVRPQDCGSTHGSHHAATLTKLARHRVAEVAELPRTARGQRGTSAYRITAPGHVALAEREAGIESVWWKGPLTQNTTKRVLAEYPGPGLCLTDEAGVVVAIVMPDPTSGEYHHAAGIQQAINSRSLGDPGVLANQIMADLFPHGSTWDRSITSDRAWDDFRDALRKSLTARVGAAR